MKMGAGTIHHYDEEFLSSRFHVLMTAGPIIAPADMPLF
jgi:hypothetical protein